MRAITLATALVMTTGATLADDVPEQCRVAVTSCLPISGCVSVQTVDPDCADLLAAERATLEERVRALTEAIEQMKEDDR